MHARFSLEACREIQEFFLKNPDTKECAKAGVIDHLTQSLLQHGFIQENGSSINHYGIADRVLQRCRDAGLEAYLKRAQSLPKPDSKRTKATAG